MSDVAPSAEWVVSIQHTRSGQGDNRIPGRTPDARLAFKKDVLKRLLQKTCAVASTHGFPLVRVLMGNVNLKASAVEEAMQALPGTDVDLQLLGGEGGRGQLQQW
ncbi:MAG: hypothetical protein GY772_22865 [bacterium]|nr:hypothetical protein [bacterium]